jgi:hypothetical protein
MKKVAPILIALLLVTAAYAQQRPFVAIRVNVPVALASQTLPVLASADLAAVRAALGGAQPKAGLVGATETIAGRETPLFCQLDVVGDSQVRLACLLPAGPAGERLIRVMPNTPSLAPPGPGVMKVERQGQAVTIASADFVVTHDPTRNGGLPSRIGFPRTGKVCDTFQLNDRLHSKQEGVGGFRLSEDKTPEVNVVAAGPLYAEVQVKARYMQGAKAAPGQARAVYTYSYFVGQPVVRIAADISQDEAFSWSELHFLELYFKDDSFTQWANSASPNLQPFANDSKSQYGPDWGLIAEGKNVIGLLDTARIYDGRNDYGRYLHGPWVQWGDKTAHFALDLWIGVADDPVAAVRQAAEAKLRVLTGTTYSAKLLGQIAALEQRGRTQPRLGWMQSLLEGALQQGTLTLAQAEAVAATMLADKPAPGKAVRLGDRVLYAIASPGLGLAVSQDHTQIVSLYDLRHRRELLATPALWFRLKLQNAAGAQRTLGSTDFFLRQPGAVITMESWRAKQPREQFQLQFFSKGSDFPGLTVTVKATLLDDRLQWSLEADNARAEWSLLSVTSPVLQVGQLGNDLGDDRVLVPSGFGRAYPVLGRPNFNVRYPSGGACMQWMAVTDDTSGLYLGCHDPTASTKQLTSDQLSGGPGVPLCFEVNAPDATVPGNDFPVPGQFVIAAVDGGYFPACRLYRQWLDRNAPWWPEPGKFSRSDYPAWLTNIQTWVEWGAGPAEKTVQPTKDFARAMGTPTAIHWYNWHAIPFDNDYPHYFPTKPGFREGVKELQQAGVRVMPYINGRLWDSDTEDFKAEAIKYATKREDGKYYIEVYGSKQELVPMCLSQTYWQDKVQEIVMRLVREEGVDGVYIDQIAAASPVLCYDKSHGHPLGGGHWWVDGYWKMLAALQQKIATVSPDKMLTTESNAEAYAKYFDAYLMCNDNSDYDVPLFSAVYGGKILMFGTYMANSDWEDLTLMAVRQGKLFAFGAQLWWSVPTVVNNASATQWLSNVAHVRQRVNEFFVHGQMAAPPTFAQPLGRLETPWRQWGNTLIVIHTPDLWATTWRLEDGRLMMPLVNLPKQDRTVTLQFDPTVYGLKAQAKLKIERVTATGVTETNAQQGKFALPVKLGPAEATALVFTPQ